MSLTYNPQRQPDGNVDVTVRVDMALEAARQREARRPKPLRSATEIIMPTTEELEGEHVRVGSLVVHRRADDGPLKYGDRAVVVTEAGERYTGESGFFALYQELLTLAQKKTAKS